ncbi:MAG: hypothetical protein ACRC4J_05540 [Cetobacterium sp.]
MNDKIIYFESNEYKKILRSSKKIIEKNINQNINQKEEVFEIKLNDFYFCDHKKTTKNSRKNEDSNSAKTSKNNNQIKKLILNFGGIHE